MKGLPPDCWMLRRGKAMLAKMAGELFGRRRLQRSLQLDGVAIAWAVGIVEQAAGNERFDLAVRVAPGLTPIETDLLRIDDEQGAVILQARLIVDASI